MVDISVVSSRLVPPDILTTASSTVPALSRASKTSLDCCADTVPKVAVLGTTTEIAAATVLVLIVPEVSGVFLKFSIVGFKVQVNALVATEAVMGWIESAIGMIVVILWLVIPLVPSKIMLIILLVHYVNRASIESVCAVDCGDADSV